MRKAVVFSVVSILWWGMPLANASPFEEASDFLAKRQYLLALSRVDKEPGSSTALKAQLLNFLGAYSEAEALVGQAPRADCSMSSAGSPQALDVLASRMDQVELLIVNEEHEISRHRAQLALLLPKLAKMGFDTLAAETFIEGVERIRVPGELLVSDGVYSDEPTFRLLVDTAASLGMQLAAYDQSSADPRISDDYAENRERVQARNLASLVRSGRRVVALSGRGHLRASEQPLPAPKHLMGWHVEHSEGLRVIRVSQTDCGAKLSPTSDPMFLQGSEAERRGVDFFMLPPPRARERVLNMRGLHAFRVRNNFGRDGEVYVVEVRLLQEGASFVPLYRSLVRGGDNFVAQVPKANWRLTVSDGGGFKVHELTKSKK